MVGWIGLVDRMDKFRGMDVWMGLDEWTDG